MAIDREDLKARVARLAEHGVFIGTSSWKYPGWCGQLYDPDRYAYRGRFSQSRFEKTCLREYAEVFKTVSVDAAYYKFPDGNYLGELISQVPAEFQFALKVTDEITIKRFPNLPRFGERAGQPNPNFLDAELFASRFLEPCTPFKGNIGLLMFEFSRFHQKDYLRGRDFVAALDGFLARVPRGWRYGVEIRNRSFLQPQYFESLRRHGVAHVFNSWQAMPSVGDQLELSGSRTGDGFVAARFLLKPGRTYTQAVELFSPYGRVKEANPESRAAGGRVIKEGLEQSGGKKAFVYVNNRLEGNALETIAGMIDEAC